MAALKYERFIVKMSTEQKVRLITSTEFYKSSSVGSYEFPVFEIKDQPFDESCKGTHATHFPCDKALACSWNSELIGDVYAAVGEEARAINSFAYFNCSNDAEKENITTDNCLLAHFLAEKISGLRRGNAYVNFVDTDAEYSDEQDVRRTVRDGVLNNASPTSVVFSDITEAEAAVKRFKYGDLVYGVASTVDEALDFLYSGASFLFLSEDITDALANRLTALVDAYKQAHTRFVNDKMTESSFARLVRNFRVFDGEILDRACDNVIDIIFTMKSVQDNPPQGFASLKKGETSGFDEINHNTLAATAARQSAVLVKNEGGLLPLKHSMQIAVMGEYAKDLSYQRGYYNTLATAETLSFDAINNYELNTVGFALGYAKGERGRSDLIDHAQLLCGNADCVILYLAAPKGADRLPAEQLELLNAIAGRHAKIAAVVCCEGNIDMGFADKCDAVLLTYLAGQGGTVAALDIITGVISPSGKLASPVGLIGSDGFIEKYPVGYGLSYTKFEYTNLSVNESGVSFTVRNTGNFDGFAVPRMYVRKKNTKTAFKNKSLKGFVKVYVKKGDAVRVKIPFDETTFSLYSPEKGYYVEGGLYTVSVGETDGTDNLSGIMMLKDYDEKHTFKNAVVETSSDAGAVEFTETNLPPDVKAARKKLPFALRIVLAVVLALYVDAIIVFFAVGNAISNKDIVFYIIIAVVALVVNGLVMAYVGIVSTQRKSQKYLHPNVVLTDMLDNVGEFTEIAKVKYKQPVEEAAQEEPEVSEEQAAAEQEAEALAATYEVKFDDTDTSDAVLADKVSFGELCRNLRNFALHRGINLEITSARSLVAAIAACKLVFITSKSAELLPAFVKILNEYYGNETPIVASDDWNTLSDILWEEGDGKYVLSAFSNAVYAAHKSREQERVVVIENVNINNLGRYFGNFLEYANHPTEEYVINFNEETSFRLPDNLTYVLVAQDGILDMLPTEILNAALIADVMLSEATVTEEDVEPKLISHDDFLLMLSEAKEESFVSERIWKKVDALSETINATERFSIGNKNIIQSESFTSVMMACGADEPEAVTNMFLAKLSYILKNTHMFRQDGGEKEVYSIVEKLFADEELTKIKRSLTKRVRVAEVKTEDKPEAERSAQPAQFEPEAQPETEQAEQPEQAEQTAPPAPAETASEPEQAEQTESAQTEKTEAQPAGDNGGESGAEEDL